MNEFVRTISSRLGKQDQDYGDGAELLSPEHNRANALQSDWALVRVTASVK